MLRGHWGQGIGVRSCFLHLIEIHRIPASRLGLCICTALCLLRSGSNIPEFLSGWKSIFDAVQCAMRPAPGDAPAVLIGFGRVGWAETPGASFPRNSILSCSFREP